MTTRVLFATLLLSSVMVCEEKMSRPQYRDDGRLVRPEGYRNWTFVGSNIGMGYTDGAPSADPAFHNIFIQPEAFREFSKTGRFPDKTMLVMEVVTAATNAPPNRKGKFQERLRGIEVALKDESKFPEKWAYFNFIGPGDKPLAESKAFAKDACWKCHSEHGAADNVFVQFYPALREAKQRLR